MFGVTTSGHYSAPEELPAFGPGASPVVPAYSAGNLYTLDQDQPGQPKLWTVDPETGAMQTVHGAPVYPAKSVTEKADFQGAEVLVDGPGSSSTTRRACWQSSFSPTVAMPLSSSISQTPWS